MKIRYYANEITTSAAPFVNEWINRQQHVLNIAVATCKRSYIHIHMYVMSNRKSNNKAK